MTVLRNQQNKSTQFVFFCCLLCYRLQRVCQRQEYRSTGDAPHPQDADHSRVALFNDYAVLERLNKTYVIGSLVRLVRVGDHGRQEYKRPVAYNDPKKVLSVSSKLTIRLDRTLSRFLRPRLLNCHSPISLRMLTWWSPMQVIPPLSPRRSTGKSNKA